MTIFEILIAIAPPLGAVLAMIASTIKMIKSFKVTVDEIKASTDLQILLDQVRILVSQNCELKKQLDEVIIENKKVRK